MPDPRAERLARVDEASNETPGNIALKDDMKTMPVLVDIFTTLMENSTARIQQKYPFIDDKKLKAFNKSMLDVMEKYVFAHLCDEPKNFAKFRNGLKEENIPLNAKTKKDVKNVIISRGIGHIIREFLDLFNKAPDQKNKITDFNLLKTHIFLMYAVQVYSEIDSIQRSTWKKMKGALRNNFEIRAPLRMLRQCAQEVTIDADLDLWQTAMNWLNGAYGFAYIQESKAQEAAGRDPVLVDYVDEKTGERHCNWKVDKKYLAAYNDSDDGWFLWKKGLTKFNIARKYDQIATILKEKMSPAVTHTNKP